MSTTGLIEKNKDSKLTWTDSHCKPSESSNLLSAGTKQCNNSKYLKFSPKKEITEVKGKEGLPYTGIYDKYIQLFGLDTENERNFWAYLENEQQCCKHTKINPVLLILPLPSNIQTYHMLCGQGQIYSYFRTSDKILKTSEALVRHSVLPFPSNGSETTFLNYAASEFFFLEKLVTKVIQTLSIFFSRYWRRGKEKGGIKSCYRSLTVLRE